mgnify:CR=1 FL=1|tara:strand:- start:75 stop:368 length:294 start_codon:yes stop_codon:yes gene_type:complete
MMEINPRLFEANFDFNEDSSEQYIHVTSKTYAQDIFDSLDESQKNELLNIISDISLDEIICELMYKLGVDMLQEHSHLNVLRICLKTSDMLIGLLSE